MPHRRLSAAVVAIALLAVPATASAQGGVATPTDGFKVSRTSKGFIRLDIGPAANALYRRIAGRRAELLCQEETQATGPYLVGFSQGAAGRVFRFKLPARRKGVTLRPRVSAGFDTCALSVAPKGTRAAVTLALPLTDAGAAALAERKLLVRMVLAATVTGTLAEKTPNQAYPATDALVQALSKPAAKREIGFVEPLTGPDASPTGPGVIGVWTDGAAHATFVALTDAGRRVFVDATGETLSVNSQYVLR